MSNNNRIAKRKSEKACFTCQMDNGACDECHPCSRCIQKGTPQMCYYTSLATDNRPTQKPPAAQQLQQQQQPQINNNPFNINQSSLFQTNQNITQTTSNSNNNNNNSINSNSQPFSFKGDIIKHPTANNNGTYDNNVQQFILNELREMKEGQKKMYDEIMCLRETNEKLVMINETLLSKLNLNINSPQQVTPNTDNALSYPRNLKEMADYHSSPNLFIVFDITKNPPTVTEASKSFSKLLGYSHSEIIGLPWTQIIHPDLIENTMNVFNQRHLTGNSVEMTQLYRNKNGTVYSSLDTHTLIFNNEGRPICDIVHVRLLNPDLVPNYLQFNNNPRLRQLTSKSSISTLDDGTPPGTPLSNIVNSSRIHESPATPMVTDTPSYSTPITNTANSNTNNENNNHNNTPITSPLSINNNINNTNNNVTNLPSLVSPINAPTTNTGSAANTGLNTSLSNILAQPIDGQYIDNIVSGGDFNTSFYPDINLELDPAHYLSNPSSSDLISGQQIDWSNPNTFNLDWANSSQNGVLKQPSPTHENNNTFLNNDNNNHT